VKESNVHLTGVAEQNRKMHVQDPDFATNNSINNNFLYPQEQSKSDVINFADQSIALVAWFTPTQNSKLAEIVKTWQEKVKDNYDYNAFKIIYNNELASCYGLKKNTYINISKCGVGLMIFVMWAGILAESGGVAGAVKTVCAVEIMCTGLLAYHFYYNICGLEKCYYDLFKTKEYMRA
jgi:hypothetical protein